MEEKRVKNNVDVAKIMEEILQKVEQQYGTGYEGSLSQTLEKRMRSWFRWLNVCTLWMVST